MWVSIALCLGEGICHSSLITCTRYEIQVSNGIPIDPIVCEDDNSPHIPLLADSLPNGVQFDGKTLSGVPDDQRGRQGVIVYNDDSAVLVVFTFTDTQPALVYGFSRRIVYMGVEMDPIIPQLLVKPSFVDIQPPLMDGLHMNNQTGVIYGTPKGRARSKSISYLVTAVTSHFANVTAAFTLLYIERYEYPDRGVIACILEEEHGFNMIAPELFSLYPFQQTCHVQNTLSWSDQYDPEMRAHKNSQFPSSPHGFLRFVTHFESDYSSPTTFTLLSCSRIAIFIDSHIAPFLEEEASTAIKERSGTIFLSRGLHRVVVLLSTYSVWEGKVFFSLAFAVRSQGISTALLTSESLALPLLPPLFSSSLVTSQQDLSHTVHFPSLSLAQRATVTKPSSAFTLMDPATVRLFSSTAGNVSLGFLASNAGGDARVWVDGRVGPQVHGVLVTVRANTEFTLAHHALNLSRFDAPHVTVQQQVVDTVEAFNASALPRDVATPLLEYNATLVVREHGAFALIASTDCEVFLDGASVADRLFNATQARSPPCLPSGLASFFSLFMRCVARPSWQHASLEIVPPLAHSLLVPSSSLSTLHPVLHCTRDQPCRVKMDRAGHCHLLHRVEGVSFSSHCVVSIDTSAVMPLTRVQYKSTTASSFSVSVGGPFMSSFSHADEILPPSKIELFSGGTPLHHLAIVEAGKSFSITVALDQATGVRLQVDPPLPSSVFVNATTLAGVVYQAMNTSFTLTASNAAGSVRTTLRVVAERTADLYLRCDEGRARVLVEEGHSGVTVKEGHSGVTIEEGYSGVMVRGDAQPIRAQDVVTVTAVCYALDGCALSLHHFDEGALPPFRLHYLQEASFTTALPLPGFTVTPVVTEATAFLHHPVPTLFWSVDGFCRTSFDDLPAWLQPTSATSLGGVAEELGDFLFTATLANSTHAVDLVFFVSVIDELLLPSNSTLVTLETLLTPDDPSASTIPLFSAPNDTLTVSFISLPFIPRFALTQQVLLPPGFHNVTLPTTDGCRIDVFVHFLPVATRLPAEPALWFLLEEAIRPEDPVLQFTLFDESPGRWTELAYDDGMWDEVAPGELPLLPSASYFFRKHFLVAATQVSALGLSLFVHSGAVVYLNGERVWRVHVAEGCEKGCEPVAVEGFATPRHFEMTVDRRLRKQDNVIAVQLVPFAHATHPLFFSLSLFPIVSPVVVSTPTTPITSSFSVIPSEVDPRSLLSPFTDFTYHAYTLPSTITLSLPHLTSLSTLTLFASTHLSLQPTHIAVTGIDTDGHAISLASVNHPLLVHVPYQPLAITLPSNSSVRSVSITVFGPALTSSSRVENTPEANALHFIGAVQLHSSFTPTCPADAGFDDTPINTTCYQVIRTARQKGYQARRCVARPHPGNPLQSQGEWGAVDASHVVARSPAYPRAFIEFFYTLSGLSWDQAYSMATDLHAALSSVLRQRRLPVTACTLFAVRDASSAKEAKVQFSVQLEVPRGKVQQVRGFIVKGDAAVSGELAARFADKYPTLTDFRLGSIPVVVESSLPAGLRVVLWGGVVVLVGGAGVLGVLYREAIARSVVGVMDTYRERRRRRVCEELGVPLNMTYLPKENRVNKEAITFETPYGDIHLVPPVVTSQTAGQTEELKGFCQAIAL